MKSFDHHRATPLSDSFLTPSAPQLKLATRFYRWVYANPKYVRLLDRNWTTKLLLFFQDQRLMRWYLYHVQPHSKVWQVAHVYGDLVRHVARKIGRQGIFDLTDISVAQIRCSKRKLEEFTWAKITQTDAAKFLGTPPYDLVCSFFLLHEIPDHKKREVIDNMLNKLSIGGKALFIDYHKPAFWHPVRYILMGINRLLEPFSHTLWQHEIQDFASAASTFTWTKRTIFGGVYQCVVAQLNQPSSSSSI